MLKRKYVSLIEHNEIFDFKEILLVFLPNFTKLPLVSCYLLLEVEKFREYCDCCLLHSIKKRFIKLVI